MKDFEKFVRENVRCCSCFKLMQESKNLNLVGLDKIATWDYPASGNVLSGQKSNRAASIICDQCLDENKQPFSAIEFRNSAVIYHLINSLDDAPPLFPYPEVNCYGNLICPHCSEEIIVSFETVIKPGLGHCPFCFKPFEITVELAQLANEISANYRELSKVKING